MTDEQHPAQFDWATELSDVDAHVTLSAKEAKEIGARLRSMGAKLKVYEDLGDAGSDVQLLRMGYAAARLEIESLNSQLHAAKQINAAQFGLLAASIPGSAMRASHGQASQQEPSYTSAQLAEMVLSDCGHSSNYTPLLNRVAARIDAHVERCLESKKTPQQEAQEPAWDGKLSDATRKVLNDLYLQCGHETAGAVSFQVRKECEALYTSLLTAKRMYHAAQQKLEALETAPQPAPQQEALRLAKYVARRKLAKQLDTNEIHGFDSGCDTEAVLLLSDIEAVLSQVAALTAAQPAAPTPPAQTADSVTAPGGGVVAAGRFMDEAAERRSAQEGYEKRIKRVSERNPQDEGMYSLGWWDRAWKAAAPTPPAQAADSVLEDAARLDWLLLHISGAEFRRIGVHYSGNASRADVDAARKQGANHD